MASSIAGKLTEETITYPPPDDWPVARRIRSRLLNGEALTGNIVANDYNTQGARLQMVAAELARNGYNVDRKRLANGTVEIRVTSGKVPATVTERKQRRHDRELADLLAFHKPAPATLDLGDVLRVVMVGEHEGEGVAVLAAMDGRRFFVHIDGAQSTDHTARAP